MFVICLIGFCNFLLVTRQVRKQTNLSKAQLKNTINSFIVLDKIPELEVRAILSKKRECPQRRMSTGRSSKKMESRRQSFREQAPVPIVKKFTYNCKHNLEYSLNSVWKKYLGNRICGCPISSSTGPYISEQLIPSCVNR